MAIRVSRLLKKANIGMQSLIEIIKALGFEHYSYDISTKIPDEIANQVLALCCGDFDFLELIGHSCISPWQYNHVIQRS